MATYYLLKVTELNRYLVDYTDETTKTPREFSNPREAFRYGMQNYGVNRFEVVKEIPESSIEFEMRE